MTDKICEEIWERLQNKHIRSFGGKELLQISEQYAGVWLEHVYDAVLYAKLDKSKLYIARNTIEIFIDNQIDGQYPFCVKIVDDKVRCGYSQIQECVSFLTLAYEVSEMLNSREFDLKVYKSGVEWVNWLKANRMTMGTGLTEMFVGYDTGHDNSGRLEGLVCKGNYVLPDGTRANAAVLPENEETAPVIAVDMNCNFFGNLTALSKFARKLGLMEEAVMWEDEAKGVKKKLIEVCYDEADAFFYDVDKKGNKRRYLSCTIFHLFMEKVLDRDEDKELIEKLKQRHIMNENEFMTEYPFPSMAVNDASCECHDDFNCWGYFTQGLIVLRCIRWMDYYNMSEEFDYICGQWLKAWTDCFEYFKLGQELDPHTGKPTKSSEWYSSCMLMYYYAAERLSKI